MMELTEASHKKREKFLVQSVYVLAEFHKQFEDSLSDKLKDLIITLPRWLEYLLTMNEPDRYKYIGTLDRFALFHLYFSYFL